jgi:hypothetical protein
VVKISGSAFARTSLHSLTARGFSTTGSLFTHFQKVVRCLGEPKIVRIPSTFREIGENSFHWVSSLVDLSFEEGVERIKSSAFRNCDGLKAVAFPASLVAIDENAFDSCHALCEVGFAADSKLQAIGKFAFEGSPLKKVCLPLSASEIDPFAFSLENWPSASFYERGFRVCVRYHDDAEVFLTGWHV